MNWNPWGIHTEVGGSTTSSISASSFSTKFGIFLSIRLSLFLLRVPSFPFPFSSPSLGTVLTCPLSACFRVSNPLILFWEFYDPEHFCLSYNWRTILKIAWLSRSPICTSIYRSRLSQIPFSYSSILRSPAHIRSWPFTIGWYLHRSFYTRSQWIHSIFEKQIESSLSLVSNQQAIMQSREWNRSRCWMVIHRNSLATLAHCAFVFSGNSPFSKWISNFSSIFLLLFVPLLFHRNRMAPDSKTKIIVLQISGLRTRAQKIGDCK